MTSKSYLNLPKTNEEVILDLQKEIKRLNDRLSKLEERVPKSYDIFYKPPGQETHQKLHLSLDELYARINKVEERIEG